MKTQIKSESVVLLLAGMAIAVSTLAHAGEPGNQKAGPCKEIKAACEAAGFVKGGHKSDKGLWKDCIQKIKEGQSVAGVNVSPDQVAACKATVQKHRERKAKGSVDKK